MALDRSILQLKDVLDNRLKEINDTLQAILQHFEERPTKIVETVRRALKDKKSESANQKHESIN